MLLIKHFCSAILIEVQLILIQETPTKELGHHSDSNSQVPEYSNPGPTTSYLNRFTNSESSTDEEGHAKAHQMFPAVENNLLCRFSVLTRSFKSLQVVVLSGMMTSPPLQLPSCPRWRKNPQQRLRPLQPRLAFPLRHQ